MTLNSADQQHRQTSASGASAASSTPLPRIALVGVHGYGSQHLVNLRRLQQQGRLELVAAADPHAPEHLDFPAPVAIFASLEELLGATPAVDVVIIATPIQTHAPLALTAMAAEADVYLEKPPVTSLEQYEQLLQAAAHNSSSVQIGFQSLGSHALTAIADLIASGRIGEVRSISATGQWVRTRAYYQRSPWAGKRRIQGTDVVDGVATNPLAHAVATALHIAGARETSDIAGVDTDLYHAHDIESDDTSVIRIRTTNGPTVTCALTLCAAESEEPYVTIDGTAGQAVFYYTADLCR
ncbi:Gfo/Idh/MocA family oxidoreductase [Arthrobacter castelli]|uniref:Gfo/Idh/MocA family protein n=1 Tax=Arthrobacter castelli TaxID=271431 RepID=UPI0004299178